LQWELQFLDDDSHSYNIHVLSDSKIKLIISMET
jgi:hypothetical protein